MVNSIEKYSKAYVDSDGNSYTVSDRSTSVFSYDSSSESWKRDFSNTVNPFFNPNFSMTTVTGSVSGGPGNFWYEDGSYTSTIGNQDGTRQLKISRIPFNYRDDFLSKADIIYSSNTLNGNVQYSNVDFFGYGADSDVISSGDKNRFPHSYTYPLINSPFAFNQSGWTTVSGTPGNNDAEIIYQLDEQRSLKCFFVDSWYSNSFSGSTQDKYLSSIGSIEVLTTTSGNGLIEGNYTSVYSDSSITTGDPIFIELENPVDCTFVKIKFSNKGYSGYSFLGRFQCYEQDVFDKGLSVHLSKYGTISTSSNEFYLSQDIDLSDSDYIYFSVENYYGTNGSYGPRINIDDIFVEELWAPPFKSTVSSNLYINAIYRDDGMSFDVRDFSGPKKFSIGRKRTNASQNQQVHLLLTNFTNIPTWYSEEYSSKRGSLKKFPDVVSIFSDTKGLSIVDQDTDLLWMRFDYGYLKMLRKGVRCAFAKNGKVYLGTSSGLIVLDFPANKSYHLDTSGLFSRFDISLRNKDCFDRLVQVNDLASTYDNCQFSIHAYNRENTDIYLENSCIDNIYVDDDEKIILATSSGLAVLDGELKDGNFSIYYSKNKEKTSNIFIRNGSLWYTQGDRYSYCLKYIEDYSSISTNFIEDKSFTSSLDLDLPNSFSKDFWKIIDESPHVQLTLVSGEVFKISGEHLESGVTGLQSIFDIPDISYTLKAKVKINSFPKNSRGGFRFGVGFNSLGNGYLSGLSDEGKLNKEGFFLSALNVDTYGTPIPENHSFTYYKLGRGWAFESSGNDGASAFQIAQPLKTTQSGVEFFAPPDDVPTGLTTGNFTTRTAPIPRINTTYAFYKRDFILRLKVKLIEGFIPQYTSVESNPYFIAGISSREYLVPELSSVYNSASTLIVDKGLSVGGSTTQSGTQYYSFGQVSNAGEYSNEPYGIIINEAEDNKGHDSPYREWTVEYSHLLNTVSIYIEGEYLGAKKLTNNTNDNLIAVVLGFGTLRNFQYDEVACRANVKDVTIEYPELSYGSNFKYGVEYTDSIGRTFPLLYTVPTSSGIYKESDMTPASGTVSYLPSLSDNNLNSISVTVSSGNSFGLELQENTLVDKITIHDTLSGTDGWQNFNYKGIQLWTSEDSEFWEFSRELDLSSYLRKSGKVEIPLVPAVSGTAFKLVPNSSSYNVSGGSPWTVSELRVSTFSGIDFYGNDNTINADFREWKIEYNKDSGVFKSYIDGTQVTESGPYSFDKNHKIIVSNSLIASSGTVGELDVEFKDVNISYDGILGSGELHSVFVSDPTISGSSIDYTIISSTDEHVQILDKDLSDSPILTDRIVQLNSQDGLYFSPSLTSVSFLEKDRQRGKGVAILASDRNNLKTYDYTKYPTKNFWISRADGRAAGFEISKYGNRTAMYYLQDKKKILYYVDSRASYMEILDLETGLTERLERNNWIEDNPDIEYDFNYHDGHHSGEYDPSSQSFYLVAEPAGLVKVDINTGYITKYNYISNIDASSFNSAAFDFNLGVFVIYNRYLYGVDTLNSKVHTSYRNDVESITNLIQEQLGTEQVLYGAQSFNSFGSVYCDFDRKIYILGMNSYIWGSDTVFLSYDVEHDYVELLDIFNDNSIDWPHQQSLTGSIRIPHRFSSSKESDIIYSPVDKKIYFICRRAYDCILFTFDVVNRIWEESDFSPPITSAKGWPDSLSVGSVTQAEYNTNLITYDHCKDEIVFSTSNKATNTNDFFTYKPYSDFEVSRMSYRPGRDGLPLTASGSSKHFTINDSLIPSIDATANAAPVRSEFLDYVRHTNFDTTEVGYYLFNEGPVTVFSGTSDTFQFTDFPVESMFNSTAGIPANSDIEINFEFSVPSFSKNAYISTYGSVIGEFIYANPRCEFMVALSDGWGYPFRLEQTGKEKSYNMTQIASARIGIVGPPGTGNSSDFDVKAYVRLVDGFNDGLDGDEYSGYYPENRMYGEDTYDESPIEFTSPFSDWKSGKIIYSYETDEFEFLVDGVSAGKIKMRRKFRASNGVHVGLGFSQFSRGDSGKEWVVKVKNFRASVPAFSEIKSGRLITTVSGAYGSYNHEVSDSGFVSTNDWVVKHNVYVPSSLKYPGFDYITTLIGVEDEKKKMELVAFISPGNKKMVGIPSLETEKNDSTTYLSSVEIQWDDIELGDYRVEKNTEQGTVSVYLSNSDQPSMIVNYDELPAGRRRRLFYGRETYSTSEKVYINPVKNGSWTTTFYTTGTQTAAHETIAMSYDHSAYFATIDQGGAAYSRYTLDEGLGSVKLYAFFVSHGYDSCVDAPYVVTSSGIVEYPTEVGSNKSIASISINTDENGNPNSSKTLLRVDQSRDMQGNKSSVDPGEAQSSGWVYLGTYDNPTEVLITASGTVGSASSKGFVCADAIGVDIGRYGKSKVKMSTGSIEYNIGRTDFYSDNEIKSGLSVVDTNTGEVLASYSENTPEFLDDDDITSGGRLG